MVKFISCSPIDPFTNQHPRDIGHREGSRVSYHMSGPAARETQVHVTGSTSNETRAWLWTLGACMSVCQQLGRVRTSEANYWMDSLGITTGLINIFIIYAKICICMHVYITPPVDTDSDQRKRRNRIRLPCCPCFGSAACLCVCWLVKVSLSACVSNQE